MTFRQLVGCRTQSPERIAEGVGGVAGAAEGSSFGIWGVVGGWLGGRRIGREVIEEFMVFPPIWSELSLTIHADGSSDQQLDRHSLFPSLCFYHLHPGNQELYDRTSWYDARSRLNTWKQNGWGDGNPWHIPNPSGWGDNRERHANLGREALQGIANFSGPVRGSVATYQGSIRGGSRRQGPIGV